MYYQALSKAIADGFPSLSSQLQLAARRGLDRPDGVALITVRGLALNAGFPPTTMARLARRFVFDSFNEFLTLFEKNACVAIPRTIRGVPKTSSRGLGDSRI